MKALIDTTTSVNHIVSWNGTTPVIEIYPNSQRLCEVAEQEFPVADNLFWIDCANSSFVQLADVKPTLKALLLHFL